MDIQMVFSTPSVALGFARRISRPQSVSFVKRVLGRQIVPITHPGLGRGSDNNKEAQIAALMRQQTP